MPASIPQSPKIDFSPLSSTFADNPYKVYKQLQALDEPFYFADMNMWLLSRYDDVSTIALNPKMVRSLRGYVSDQQLAKQQRDANWHDMPYHERVVQFSLLDSDGDVHQRLRKQVFRSFTPNSVYKLNTKIQNFVEDLLTRLPKHEEVDFIADFAAHIPGYVIGLLLGTPAEDSEKLRNWSEQIVQYFDIDRSNERKQIAETASHAFYDYLAELKNERLKAPRDDLISQMLVDYKRGDYTDDEFISTCMLILMAGHGSTIDVLGSGMHTLLAHPEAMAALRNGRELLPSAIQEIFRYEPPLPFFHRHATEPVNIRGHEFPAGSTFGLLYGAANRDPGAFTSPDDFLVNRKPNRHLAFGRGAHLCLGNHLARLNMQIVFNCLFDKFDHIELLENKVEYKTGLSLRGPTSLKLRWY